MSREPEKEPKDVEDRFSSPQLQSGEKSEAGIEDNAASPASQGWAAWLQVVGAFSLNMNTWGLMNAFGSWQTFYQLDLLRAYSAFSISWIGGVVYAVVFSRVQASSAFGWATRAVAFIVLATSILPLLFMRSRHVPTGNLCLFDRAALFDVPYMLLNIGLLFGFMGLYIIFYYVQFYAIRKIDASSPVVNYLLTILNATSLLGRVVAGFYADKIGSINMQAAVALISALLTYCLIAIRNIPGLIVFCLLYGASAGAFQGLPAAGIATLCDDPSTIGIRIGMTLAFVGVGVLVSNPIAGAILGPISARDAGDWTGLIVWCAVLLTASGICMVAARTARVGVNLKAI
ncbi:MAG: hypothetical protein Q9227_003664 [Pyrenula ochraceoflavens]